ncbi:major facilitator superfamily domain-containing protein 12-like [Montipora capricornis]|uniref:major facilitator superfamily domain-containing protein 12-like n=1 Tax=Montipora capricornis TaxID=246305 RepID=UPI0035F21947
MNALFPRHRSYHLREPQGGSRTPFFQRFACGLGHAINDITRQLLFSFRLVFFMKVLRLSAPNSGWLILEKQLVHTVMSPVCAVLVDRIRVPFLSRKLGKRKSWHFCATILEAVFVPLFFTPFYFSQSSDSEQGQMMIYFGILNVILGVAGSLLDISHLSLIPFIAKNQIEAVELSAWRTAFTYLSGISTCVVAWVIFGLDSERQISENSSKDFMVMTAILVALGVLLAMIFHIGTKEPLGTTLQAGNSVSLTSFTPSNAHGELMTRLSPGINTATTSEREYPSRRTYGVRWTAISDQKEEPASAKKAAVPKENLSSSNVNCASVDNRGFSGSIIALNSGADSDDKNVDKVPAPINLPAVSLETKGVPLPENNANINPFVSRDSESALPPRTHANRTIQEWLTDPRLYMVAVVYSCTRALQNHAYSYLPFFLIYTLDLGKESIAYLPLIMLISATVSSIFSKKLVGIIGNKGCFTIAALLVVCSGVMSYFITQSNTVMIYPSVVLLGLGFSSMLVCSLSFATELIGENKRNSGFIFAVMSLMSYVIGGPLMLVVQNLFPEGSQGTHCAECGDYMRHVFCFVANGLSTAGALVVLLLHCIDGLRRRRY